MSILTYEAPWGQQKPPYGTKVNRKDPIGKSVVGCWLFNEGAGPNAYDASGDGLNHGALQALSTGGTAWSKSGGLQFNGATGYVERNAAVVNGPPCTIIVRASLLSLAQTSTLLSICNSGSDNPFILLAFNFGTGSINGQYRNDAGSGSIFGTYVPSPLVAFTAALIVHSANNFDLYIDGQLNAHDTTDCTGSITLNRTDIGRLGRPSAGGFSNAIIDFGVILNRALTNAEVQRLYANPYCYLEPRTYYMPVASQGSLLLRRRRGMFA